jgi:hypothetical protein
VSDRNWTKQHSLDPARSTPPIRCSPWPGHSATSPRYWAGSRRTAIFRMAPTKGAKCYRRYDRLCVRGPGHRPHLFTSSGDEAKMGTGKSTVAAVLFGGLATGGATLAHAQAPISGLAAHADVRVGPNRASLVAIVTVRPRFGWGRIVLPASGLRQVGGRVVIPGTLASIRALPRLRGR